MDEMDEREREITINDVVLTACNTESLYQALKTGMVVNNLDRFIRVYAPNLPPLERVECIRQVLEYWVLDNND